MSSRLGKPVGQYTPDGKLVNVFANTKEASRKTGINDSNISRSATGKRYAAGEFLWRYVSSRHDLNEIAICQCCGKKSYKKDMMVVSLECLQKKRTRLVVI